MSVFVPIVLFGWIPVVLALFALMPPRWAFITAYLGAWMFLPMATYPIAGLPDYGKVTATNYAVLLATILFQSRRLLAVRFRWYDIPMVIYCACPFVTAMSNGLSVHDGLSMAILSTMIWGFPYFLARVYFDDWAGLKVLVLALLVAGAIYTPMCIWEIRMSPNLHSSLYGYHQHSFHQARRGSFWRPTVFMQHGLAVAMFMASAALAGLWLWWTKMTAKVGGLPMKWTVPAITATVIVSQSHLATLLMMLGIGVMALLRTSAGKLIMAALLLIPPVYMLSRTVGGWDGQLMLDVAEAMSKDRARSLEVRILSENALTTKALERPLFGWGAFGRYQVAGAVPDGMWVVTLGKFGLVGLLSFTSVLLLPPLLMLGWPRRAWREAALAPAVILALLLLLHMIDNLMNAMVNPLYMVFAGALGPVVATAKHAARKPAPAPGRIAAPHAPGRKLPVRPRAVAPLTARRVQPPLPPAIPPGLASHQDTPL